MPRRPEDRTARRRRRFGVGFGPLAALLAVASVLGAATACEPAEESGSPAAPSSTIAAGGPDASPTTPVATTGEPSDPSDPSGPSDPGDPGEPGPGGPSITAADVLTGGTAVSHTTATLLGDRSMAIVDIDFADLTFPTNACTGVIDRPPAAGYVLVDGEVRAGAPTDDDAYSVTLEPTMSYGDVDGDGNAEVALVLDCARGNRPVPVGWIYTLDPSGRPLPMAQVALDPDVLPLSGVLDTGLHHVAIEDGGVLSDWVIYVDGDALCCPSRTATVRWTWTGGGLAADAPVIARNTASG